MLTAGISFFVSYAPHNARGSAYTAEKVAIGAPGPLPN